MEFDMKFSRFLCVLFLIVQCYGCGNSKNKNQNRSAPELPLTLTSQDIRNEFSEKYQSSLSPQLVDEIIRSTRVLAIEWTMNEEDWYILLDRKMYIASLSLEKKALAKSKVEQVAWSEYGKKLMKAEDLVTLIENADQKKDYLNKLDNLAKRYSLCISSAGGKFKGDDGQMHCSSRFHFELAAIIDEL